LELNKNKMSKAREYLKSFGYELVVNNVSPDQYTPYEDWWVYPELVSRCKINQMRSIMQDEGNNVASDYMILK